MGSTIRSLLAGRFVRFAGIGLICLVLIQQPILLILVEVGIAALVANAVGFMLSSVINYEAQRRYNFDRRVRGSWWGGLGKFQLASLGSLGVNTIVFAAMYYGVADVFPQVTTYVAGLAGGRVDLWAWLAAFVGAVSGTGCNFIISRMFIFGGHRGRHAGKPAMVEEVEQTPSHYDVQAAAADKTLAFFMPAYNEALNLPVTVPDLHAYLASLGLLEFRIFIINDGSPDNTREVAERLAAWYPEVEVINHPHNKGYGGALISGFNAAVQTGFDLWAFFDADRQFATESIGTLLVAQAMQRADMAVGRRLGRRTADSPFRFWLGRAWHFFGRAVVGRNADGQYLLSVHDVDCGLKLGRVKSLALIAEQLRGQAAAISPELIARANIAGQTIVECGVTHLPRVAGESTGDKLSVMVRSGFNILKLGARFRLERYFGWVSNAAEDAQASLMTEGR